MDWLLLQIDPVLIRPYRWFDGPMLSWWLGTFFVALWAAVIGQVTMALVNRVNRDVVKEQMDETSMYQERSMNALKSGDKKAYKQINKLANEAFGKSFFTLAAMGMASLWPVFFAAAWLEKRFGEFVFTLPAWAGGVEFSFLAPFIILYIAVSFLLYKAKPYISLFRPPGRDLSSSSSP